MSTGRPSPAALPLEHASPPPSSSSAASQPSASPAAAPPPLAPHPLLSDYYADAPGKRSYLRRMFDATAGDYDRVEAALSLGSGRWYRRRALRRAGLRPGMQLLDIASGTGLVAREALTLLRTPPDDGNPFPNPSPASAPGPASSGGNGGGVLLLDPSPGMLSRAQRALGLPAVLAVGEALPLPDATFDFLSMGYALRHLPDLHQAFAEFHRVLRPGGRLCLLEITRPTNPFARAACAAYFRGILPLLARALRTSAATRDLWTYYWETIDACIPPTAVLAALTQAGFSHPQAHRDLGLFTAYTATR